MKTSKTVNLKGTIGIAREHRKLTGVSDSQLLRDLLYDFGLKLFGKGKCDEIVKQTILESKEND
jgi:hypothetical protein